MKKKILGIALCMVMALPVFARESDSGLGFSLGARLSVLGLEPTVSLLLNHLEIEASAPMHSQHLYDTVYEDDGVTIKSQTTKGYVFGFAPEVSVGYNSKPFTSGWQNGFGASVLWLTDSYINAFQGYESTSSIFNSDGTLAYSQGVYIGSLYYRGALQWKSGFSIYFRLSLPVALYTPELGSNGLYTIMESEVAATAMVATFLTAQVGVRFTF